MALLQDLVTKARDVRCRKRYFCKDLIHDVLIFYLGKGSQEPFSVVLKVAGRVSPEIKLDMEM